MAWLCQVEHVRLPQKTRFLGIDRGIAQVPPTCLLRLVALVFVVQATPCHSKSFIRFGEAARVQQHG